jgi:beta-phosphoglucomutase-like phosphatase (HAD superfamily)
MAELLKTLREAGVKTSVASVSHNVWEIVGRLGITDSVDAIVGPAALVKGKPDPEAFFKAADMLGVPYEDCAAVEDAQVGVEAIKAARMLAVGIGRELVGADWRLDRTDQLTYDGLLQHFVARNSAPVASDGEAAVSEA